MHLSYIDYPRFIPEESYDLLIKKLLSFLSGQPGFLSVYQIGSITHPGISDIDLVCVFNDHKKNDFDLRSKLTPDEKYLLVHSLYGVNQSLLKKVLTVSIFQNYKLLAGIDQLIKPDLGDDADILNIQIALEYLLKMYITLTIQLEYKVIKLRSLLLEAKAIKYDLEFLDLNDGPLYNLIFELLEWRENWFESIPKENFITNWIKNFYSELKKLLELKLDEDGIFLPYTHELVYSKNITLKPGQKLSYNRQGIILPKFIRNKSRRLFNLNNRFNHFVFTLPWLEITDKKILGERFLILKEHKDYNSRYLPAFSPLVTSLNIW